MEKHMTQVCIDVFITSFFLPPQIIVSFNLGIFCMQLSTSKIILQERASQNTWTQIVRVIKISWNPVTLSTNHVCVLCVLCVLCVSVCHAGVCMLCVSCVCLCVLYVCILSMLSDCSSELTLKIVIKWLVSTAPVVVEHTATLRLQGIV